MDRPAEADEELKWLRTVTGRQTITDGDLRFEKTRSLPRPVGLKVSQGTRRWKHGVPGFEYWL